MFEKSVVSLVKTDDRVHGTRKAIELLGGTKVEKKRVLLKPNFNSADPTPGSTHNDTLRTIVEILQKEGAKKITIGDRSGMGNTREVFKAKGIFKLGEKMGLECIIFDEMLEDKWVHVSPENTHWNDGFYVASPVLEADAVVTIPSLKTHRFGGHFTMALKLSVGIVHRRNMGELHRSRYQRQLIAEVNQVYAPSLIVLDGVECFVNGGPDKGTLKRSNLILAGTDRIAIDAIGVAILKLLGTTKEIQRKKVFEQDQITRAVELGLGVDSPDKIMIITPNAESEKYAKDIRSVLLEE